MLAIQEIDTPVYEKLKQLSRAERKRLRKRSQLTHALYVAGIGTLNRESVERYQAKRIEECRYPKAVSREVFDESYDILRFLSVLVAFGFALSLLLTIIMPSLVAAIGNAVGFALSLGLAKSIGGKARTKTIMVPQFARKDAEWRTRPLEQCVGVEGRIPKVEREKVKELRARLPQVQAVVHYLYEDPFLEVVFEESGRRESAFIGFWSEKGFNA